MRKTNLFVLLIIMITTVLLLSSCGPQNSELTEEEIMEHNAQMLQNRLGIYRESAEEDARILEGIGVGKIDTCIKEAHSNEYAFFVTIVDEHHASYYISMDASGIIAFIARDNASGEMLYQGAFSSLVNEDNTDFIQETIEGSERQVVQ